MADNVEFRITDNAEWVFPFRIDEEDAPKNLTGATFSMDVREKADSTLESASLTSSGGEIVIGTPLTDGEIEIHFTEGILDPGYYVFDLICTISGEDEIIMRGTIKVDQGVTR